MNAAVDHTDDYGWVAEQATHSQAYIAPHLVPILRRLGARRVLDLGAGNGALCGLLARHGFDVVGVEFDARGVDIARAAHPAIRFYRMGVQDDPSALTSEQQPFDAVVSTEVIEHLYSPHLLPGFARALLLPEGHLIVTTPYHGYLKNLALSLFDKWDHHHTALWHGGHIKFWSRATLTTLLHDNGFQLEAFHGLGRAPWMWKSMLLVARRSGVQPPSR